MTEIRTKGDVCSMNLRPFHWATTLVVGLTPACGSRPADFRVDAALRDAGPVRDAAFVEPAPYRGELGTLLFVTQVPVGGFVAVSSNFPNHLGTVKSAPRGGGLVIRYPDGTLRDLTREAGYGGDGLQGASAVAVREPTVHFDGNRALVSMVVGAPERQFGPYPQHFQIYEVTGLARGEPVAFRRVEGQPADYDNVSPIYGSDGRILFVSSRPRSGEAHLAPQLDEYESNPSTAGIYALDEASRAIELLEHAPSGVFGLSLDSAGRVVFSKWDHLQRDQQGDDPTVAARFNPLTYASEAADAVSTRSIVGQEFFPEVRSELDADYDATVSLHTFNHFFPWTIEQDGTDEETLNHVGRQELGGPYTGPSFPADPNLTHLADDRLHLNRVYARGSAGLFHLRESPTEPGVFYTTFADEFGTAQGGEILRLTGAEGMNPEDMTLTHVTPEVGVPSDTGYFRNPTPLSNGTLVAVHTPATGPIANDGTAAAPAWSYAYRLRHLEPSGDRFVAGAPLTGGIHASLSYWDPDVLVTFDGNLWELDPVEVRPRPVPRRASKPLPAPEQSILDGAGVTLDALRAWLRARDLAMVIGRNVTQRDRADRMQPFNLYVPSGVRSVGAPGTEYAVSFLQFFQADAVRAYGTDAFPLPGRRLLARPVHDVPALGFPASGPAGSVALGADGSFAALVPARRAMTWQLTDPRGVPVVRERNWVSFQPGEVRVCASCHGINRLSQTGDPPPTNAPAALGVLLNELRAAGGL